MENNQYKVFRSIWFWWVLTTVLYLGLNPFMDGNHGILGYVGGFVGLFVPYGYFSSFLFLASPLSGISVVFFIFAMISLEKMIKIHNLSLVKKILFNLVALMIITAIVDLIRDTPFYSWHIFIQGSISGIFSSI